MAMACAGTAYAASTDYLLELDGVKGESAGTIEVHSWSFGVCNAGQCSTPSQRTVLTAREAGSGLATGKTGKSGKPSAASWDLATAKGARLAASGQVNVAVGDLDGDGAADLAYAGAVSEVFGLSFTFQKIEGVWREICGGKHFDKVTLRSATGDAFEITGAAASCAAGGGAAAASYAATGKTSNAMPNRLSMNVTTPKQTQGATFGEKCQAGLQCAGAVTMTLTGGQMKHTKTGHVTLLK